ncbi:MAG: heavy-metal-associated domain-containing protein [Acidimicrobiia bacterium]|nr:heavy-metal-associated domain-containing protein [Acidimicrobiia bacterium]
MTDITLSVPDISCDHCKHSIEGAVGPLDGVDSAEVSIADRTVRVAFDPTRIDLDTIKAAIDDQGYDVAS